MDVFYDYRGLSFVWNATKAGTNLAKHGVKFESAAEVFTDFLAEFIDASTPEETRLAVIGETRERNILYVVHV